MKFEASKDSKDISNIAINKYDNEGAISKNPFCLKEFKKFLKNKHVFFELSISSSNVLKNSVYKSRKEKFAFILFFSIISFS